MIEPNKVYHSGYLPSQEASLYGGTSFSSNFKYTMDSFRKGAKIQNILRILLFIFGFLLIATLFTLLGLFLYPKLVRVCKKEIYSDLQKTETGMNDGYLPSLSELFSGMGICKESSNNTQTERLQRNVTKTEKSFEKVGNNTVQNNKCKCLNASKKANTLGNDTKKEMFDTEFGLHHQCTCDTESDDDFEKNKIKNKSEKFDNNFHTINREINLNDSHNKTHDKNGRKYLQSDACDCKNISKMNNSSLNGTENSHQESNKCKCPEVSINASEAEYVSKKNDSISLGANKCHCFDLDKVKNGILNGSEFNMADVNFAKSKECVCPETQVLDFINNKTRNGTQKHIMESLNVEEINYVTHHHFNETQTMNGSHHLTKERCICTSISNTTDILNTTTLNNEVRNSEFDKVGDCKCPEPLGNVSSNLNKTTLESETNNASSLLSEECVCLNLSQTINNETITNRNKLGVRTANGTCICPEARKVNYFNTSEKSDVNIAHNVESPGYSEVFLRNDSKLSNPKTENESQPLKSDKCICPKLHDSNDGFNETNGEIYDIKGGDNCKCSGPEILEIDQFDLHETSSGNDQSEINSVKSHECICPEIPESLENGSAVERNNFGIRTDDGKCVCPEIFQFSDFHSNVTEVINAKKTTYDNEEATINEKKNVYNKETEKEVDSENSYEKEILSANEESNDNENVSMKKQKNIRKKKM